MGNYGHTVRSDTAVLPDFKHTGQSEGFRLSRYDCFLSVDFIAEAHADKVRFEMLGS